MKSVTNHNVYYCKSCNGIFRRVGRKDTCSLKCRIIANVEKNKNGCWIWKKEFTINGRPKILVDKKYHLVLRVVYELYRGPLQKSHFIYNTCDQKTCVNPEHLYVVPVAPEGPIKETRPMTGWQKIKSLFSFNNLSPLKE